MFVIHRLPDPAVNSSGCAPPARFAGRPPMPVITEDGFESHRAARSRCPAASICYVFLKIDELPKRSRRSTLGPPLPHPPRARARRAKASHQCRGCFRRSKIDKSGKHTEQPRCGFAPSHALFPPTPGCPCAPREIFHHQGALFIANPVQPDRRWIENRWATPEQRQGRRIRHGARRPRPAPSVPGNRNGPTQRPTWLGVMLVSTASPPAWRGRPPVPSFDGRRSDQHPVAARAVHLLHHQGR